MPCAGEGGSSCNQSKTTHTYSQSTTSTWSSPTLKPCQSDLIGDFQFPHLIIPVNGSAKDEAYHTSFNGTITPDVSSIFNFDIPASYGGKTCSLVFLFPRKDQLETSSFTFNGKGGIKVSRLRTPASSDTTFNNAPYVAADLGSIWPVPGSGYIVNTGVCAAGQTIAYRLSSVLELSLNYFQDFNPKPIGLYITTC
jgi:hypothetical protein